MTLEILYKREYIQSHPWSFLVLLAFAISVSILAALILSPRHASILALCFLVFLLIPIFFDILAKEEYLHAKHIKFMNKHVLAFAFLTTTICIFVGFFLWAILLPQSVSNTLLSAQYEFLETRDPTLLAAITAKAVDPSADFWRIFFNNMAVVHAIILISLVFGSGSLFIIVWNVSVFVAFTLNYFVQQAAATSILHFIGSVIFHVVLEFSAYAVAAIAGCLISIAILKHPFFSVEFKTILKDAGLYYGACIVLLLLGAAFEVIGFAI